MRERKRHCWNCAKAVPPHRGVFCDIKCSDEYRVWLRGWGKRENVEV